MANPLNQFVSINGDVDLTSAVSIFSEANAGSFTRWVVLRFEIGDGSKDLASAADTVLTFVVTRGGKYLTTLTVTVPDAHDQLSVDTEPLTWKTGETIAVTLESDQAGDTDVDVTVEALDVAPLQPATSGRTLEVESDGVAHADLKEVAGSVVEKSSSNRLRVDAAEWNDIELSITNPLPNAAADAAGGLPVSDAGGLDLDTKLANANEITAARMQVLTDWIDGGRLDLLIDTLTSRLTAARAGYLDNLGIGGNVAAQSDVAAITQAQRVRVAVPQQLERPDSSDQDYRVYIYVYNETHVAEDLDSNPTVTVANAAGTDRSGNLGTVTKPSGTGIYYVDYTVDSGDPLEQLNFQVTATEGGVDTVYPSTTIVVDTTAVDYTSTDRARDDAAKTILDNLPNSGSLNDLAAALGVLQSVTHGNAALKTLIDAIVEDTNELQTDDIPGLIANLNDISEDQVNAQVVDVLSTDTHAEPGQGAPPATTTLTQKINYLYKSWRNKKEQTASEFRLFADDGSTVDQKATVSDDGTTTSVGEQVSGP